MTASGDGATEEEARANAFFSDDGSEILLNAEWMNVDVEVTNNGSSVHVDVTATAKPEFNPNCSEP